MKPCAYCSTFLMFASIMQSMGLPHATLQSMRFWTTWNASCSSTIWKQTQNKIKKMRKSLDFLFVLCPGAPAFCTKGRPHFCAFCHLEICAKCGIIIIVKRGYTLRLIQKPKAPTEEQKRCGGRLIQKIFQIFSKKPLDKAPNPCYNLYAIKRSHLLKSRKELIL